MSAISGLIGWGLLDPKYIAAKVAKYGITIGSDPEIFIKRNNIVTSAFRLTHGTKDVPEDVGGGYFLSLDNITLEGNIPPASSKAEFKSNMNKLVGMMSERAGSMKMTLYPEDVAYPDDRTLRRPDANIFGCSSYMSAYANGEQAAESMSTEKFRVAG